MCYKKPYQKVKKNKWKADTDGEPKLTKKEAIQIR